MFSALSIPEDFELNVATNDHFEFVFENSVRAWRHCFRETLFPKCFTFTWKRKPGVFRFFLWKKAPFLWQIRVDGRPNGKNKAAFSSCLRRSEDAVLAQTDTDEPITRDVGKITIGVKGHPSEQPTSGRYAEVWWKNVQAPICTQFVTERRVSGNEKAGVRCRTITDQQLVKVRWASSHTIPQSIGSSSLPIVRSDR